MLTRSKSVCHFNFIDFNEASRAWRANKKSIGNGSYKYICCGITKSGNHCRRESIIYSDYCKTHIPTATSNLGVGNNILGS